MTSEIGNSQRNFISYQASRATESTRNRLTRSLLDDRTFSAKYRHGSKHRRRISRNRTRLCHRLKPKRKLPPGSKRKVSAKRRSTSSCATGCSAGSVTGASHSRLSGRRCRRESVSRSVAGIRVAGFAAGAHGLQAHRHRRAAARPRQGLGESARRLGARNEHHAAMGRQLLVLSPLPRREKSECVRQQGSGTVLDG